MKLTLILVLLTLLRPLAAQEISHHEIRAEPLRNLEVRHTTELGGVIAGRLDCDAAGNIYVPEAPSILRIGRPFASRLAADGIKQATFSIPDLPALKDAVAVGTMTFGPGGEFIMLAGTPSSNYLLKFRSDGTLRQTLPFPTSVIGEHLGVFKSGRLFVSTHEEEMSSGRTQWSFGIFSPDGKLLHHFQLPRSPIEQESLDINSQREFADVSAGEDDMYFGVTHGPLAVYVITDNGKIDRVLHLEFPHPMARPLTIHVSKRQLAALFIDSTSRILLGIYDGLTGNRIRLFDATDMGTALACYDAATERFTFIGVGNNQKRIVIATPQMHGRTAH